MLHIHRSERADGLAAALAALLREPPEDPLSFELVAVPTRGMERWLAQQLAARLGARPGRSDGVCAGIAFPSPAELTEEALAAASGIAPDEDPWRPERACWPLLEVLERSLDEPWLEPLARYLGHGRDEASQLRARRLGIVRRLAGLFHRYALERPELLDAWRAGALGEPSGGASSAQAGSSAPWQAELFRRLRASIGVPDPAERAAAACALIRRRPELLALPARLAIFGLTRMPPGQLRVLRALGASRELHLFLLHPSPALWDALADCTRAAPPPSPLARARDRSGELARHPLLRSWGRDARELQLLLRASAGDAAQHHHPPPPAPAAGSAAGRGPARAPGERPRPTLLELIQADVRDNRPPPGSAPPGHPERRPQLDPADESIRIYACHGQARQVEVLREAILHALADDPTLEPRDVIVMCPAIDEFASLIEAVFGAAQPQHADDGPREPLALPARLADRSPRQTNPLLSLLGELLELAGGRVTASQVLDLADREPVRRRFALDDEELTRLRTWCAEAGVRWGLDAPHREPFKLGRLSQGTWRAGLDRLLLGVAMDEERQRRFARVLPLDDVDSSSIDLAGRFAELIERLGEALDALSLPQPLSAWALALRRAADLLALPGPQEAWQRAQLDRLLARLASEAEGSSEALAPAEVRALLAERLAARPTRANFRTGHLTICTLVPMRSVPHRVVCLLGLDDGAFPRRPPRDGEDVLLEEPLIGERDGRSEDRQLLLDALMAARERLIITYAGADERTGAVCPPSVPVGELLDAIDQTVCVAGARARDRVLVRHPLQPFDPRNFMRGKLIPGRSWGFEESALRGARAALEPHRPPPPFLERPLPPLEEEALELEDLLGFLAHPVRAFLRSRLGIVVSERGELLDDRLPIELDALASWQVGQRLLDALIEGVPPRAACLAAIARGSLPPGNLGEPVLTEKIYPRANAIYRVVRERAAGELEPLDVRCVLPGGATLTGTIPKRSGEVLLACTYSRLGPRQRLSAWAQLLVLTLAEPARPWRALTVGSAPSGGGRQRHGPRVALQRIGPLGGTPSKRRALAAEQLAVLLDLRARGMREPLPIFSRTSAAYASARADGRDARSAARECWCSANSATGEDCDPAHKLVLGGVVPFEQLLAAPPTADEHGPGWDPSAPSRFERLAVRLWSGLLANEELQTLG
jgi:exodeoxyribonuclease V gamma subunit